MSLYLCHPFVRVNGACGKEALLPKGVVKLESNR